MMSPKDIITMSGKELRRLKVIEKVIERGIRQREAASILSLSERQVRRIVKRVRKEGEREIIHRLRSKASNRRFSTNVKGKAIRRYQEKYIGFGPTLAQEKLLERDNIRISKETLRKWLIEEHLWERHRKRNVHRRWRERKACLGEMVQMDGSHHDWLEGRGPQLVLMGYIDDATNRVFARFYEYEGTFPAMDSFRAYIKRYGIPQSVYLDKHTTYKSTRRLTLEEEFQGI
ncbi:helix-turn-helix domain-containing protein, partial [candidate division TA06 bacterium]|nr:helix-turn-helix domain-containing protein [candidate division TA06 bacterium]